MVYFVSGKYFSYVQVFVLQSAYAFMEIEH
jgi:hypothetical protein